ncbi:MAG: hypothetical protein NT040_02265 [Bacteroidetes bacterium]|nr:hypothetical protein [Bacteroidota bacterium]
MNIRFTIFFFFIGTMLLSAQEPVPRDTFDITRFSMQFPHHYQKWGFQVSAGLSMVKPPKDLLENSYQAPLVNVHSTFGLPWNFSLEGDLTTLVVSNQLALGPRYSFLYKNLGIKVGWDVAFVYGQLKQGGFDNSLQAWFHYPSLSVGYKLKKMAFTLKGELVIIAKAVTKTGENELTHSTNFINGGTFAFYIEQRIHKNKVFVIGVKDNYEKAFWPTWMIFTTFNRYYHIPELSFSWIL